MVSRFVQHKANAYPAPNLTAPLQCRASHARLGHGWVSGVHVVLLLLLRVVLVELLNLHLLLLLGSLLLLATLLGSLLATLLLALSLTLSKRALLECLGHGGAGASLRKRTLGLVQCLGGLVCPLGSMLRLLVCLLERLLLRPLLDESHLCLLCLERQVHLLFARLFVRGEPLL